MEKIDNITADNRCDQRRNHKHQRNCRHHFGKCILVKQITQQCAHQYHRRRTKKALNKTKCGEISDRMDLR